MIPEISTDPHISEILAPNNLSKIPLEDWSLGGVGLTNADYGLDTNQWHFKWSNSLQGITAETTGVSATEIYHRGSTDIKWISGTFDQNMRAVVAYTDTNNNSSIYFYDSVPAAFTALSIGAGVTPFVSLDDTRMPRGGLNDVILTYIIGTSLCVRVQRDRFRTEYILVPNLPANTKIKKFGMARNLRLQWELAH